MNQTKFKTTIAQKQWQPYCLSFHSHSVDIVILQIYHTFTALAIITVNSILLIKILKEDKKQELTKSLSY